MSGLVFGILNYSSIANKKTSFSPDLLFGELSSLTCDHYDTVVAILLTLI